MPTYTVYAPPPRKGETASAPERFAFVRDGFHVWAFLLTPLWLLRYRLWLAFVVYAVVTGLIAVVMHRFGLSPSVQFASGFLVSLLVGLEAASIRRRKLAWKHWSTLGFVVGDDAEMAERRFFAQWVKRAGETPAPPPPPARTAPPAAPPAQPDVIGLFPETGTPP
jgi:hypothetical protein